jgi:ABC-type sulfate/molybdate transport systems ATPase subunit
VLLVSEDLDELLELADRIVVMFNGRFVYGTAANAPTSRKSAATWPGIWARSACHRVGQFNRVLSRLSSL